MDNSIEISAQFDFRGETFRPTMTLDLNHVMETGMELPDYHHMLAIENGISLYSYEYEVLESSELMFSGAKGLAGDFLQQGRFDFQGFRQCWLEHRELSALQALAQRHLGVDDLSQQPALQEALLEAFRLGKESCSPGG